MVEWEATGQLSVRVIPLLYLILLLMYLDKIVCQNFCIPCDAHFEKQTRVYNLAFGLGLGLEIRVRVLC